MEDNMIPKLIHYCWFGRKPLPRSAQQCIESWRRFFPGYEIREWNEDNFDVQAMTYTREAYAARKYAFVSDYVRFQVLYQYGGLYFDTDVEVIRPMDDIIQQGAYMGWEVAATSIERKFSVNPGLGLCAPAGHPLYAEILEGFAHLNFYDETGVQSGYTMVPMVTEILRAKGLRVDGSLQTIGGITVYPADYFCPMDSVTGQLRIMDETRTIHWYTMSWLPRHQRWRTTLLRWLRKVFH